MDSFYSKRQKITGRDQIPSGFELITTITYSQRFFVHIRTVQRWCKYGKVQAYKVGHDWLILTKVV